MLLQNFQKDKLTEPVKILINNLYYGLSSLVQLKEPSN